MPSDKDSHLLTAEKVPVYLTEKADSIGVFSSDAKLKATAIVGGNVNYAFCVTEEGTGKQVFVKQAPEFVAIFGPDGLPLTSKRMQKEVDVYNEWRNIFGTDLASKYLPKIYLFDAKMMVFVMEFFDGFTLLDHDLVDSGIVSPLVSKGLGDFMGKSHSATHTSIVSSERAKYLTEHFENRAMRDIQLEYVFTKCYAEATDEQKAGLIVDDKFMSEIDSLKAAYDGKNTDNLVLSHGDLHPGSIMVRGDEVKVIDPEFTVYGPPGLDVGSLLSGYILAAVHQAFSGKASAVKSICDGAKAVWDSYKLALQEGNISQDIIKKIEIESVGFAVAEVCRTALEFAGGRKWLQFEDANIKASARRSALSIVQNCIIQRHKGGMDLLLDEMLSIQTN